ELEALQYNKALEAVFEVVGATNKYVDTQEPWALNRDGNTERLATVMRTVLEVCAFTATLLVPVMPTKARELLTKLGRSEQDVRADLARLAALGPREDAPFDRLGGASLQVGDPLFPRFRELPESI